MYCEYCGNTVFGGRSFEGKEICEACLKLAYNCSLCGRGAVIRDGYKISNKLVCDECYSQA